jgi:hypothetical protein
MRTARPPAGAHHDRTRYPVAVVSARGFVLDAAAVLVGAARLLLRHWPVLICLGLAGMAFRGAALWAAVEVSDHVNWLGHGLVILAPLGFLVAMIAMLHLLRHDLPNVDRVSSSTAPADATTGRERRLIDVATSMVVPFFAVYVSAGLLTRDVTHFVNEAGVDEFNQIDFYGTGTGPDFSRVFINNLYLVAGLVLTAWVLRFALGHAERRWKFLGFAILGALVEVYWSANVAGYIDAEKSAVQDWLRFSTSSRTVMRWFPAVRGLTTPSIWSTTTARLMVKTKGCTVTSAPDLISPTRSGSGTWSSPPKSPETPSSTAAMGPPTRVAGLTRSHRVRTSRARTDLSHQNHCEFTNCGGYRTPWANP